MVMVGYGYLYGLERFVIEFFRAERLDEHYLFGTTLAQTTCMVLVLVTLAYHLAITRQPRSDGPGRKRGIGTGPGVGSPPMKKTTDDLRQGKPGRHEFLQLPRHPLTIVLSGLKMENLGSVFRVADAALVEGIVLCGVPYTPDSLRFKKAAKGTQRWVPHSIRGDLIETVHELKEKGVRIYALEQASGSVPYQKARYDFPAALILGKEREGLDDSVIEMADGILELPMRGMGNSLNVSVACGIVVFHMIDQLESLRVQTD